MIAVRYSLTAEDLAELDQRRGRGILHRVLRMAIGALIGLLGLALAWPAFLFPWHPWTRSIANMAILGLGAAALWMGLDTPGLTWLLRQFSDPGAECEIQIYEGKVVYSRRGTSQEFRWFPERGLKESNKFFVLRAVDANFAIPKRAFTSAQENQLRELARPSSVTSSPDGGDTVECSFYFTQEELDEASTTHHGWFQRWLNTRHGRLCARGICGLGSLWLFWFLCFPSHSQNPWVEFRTEPHVAVGLLAYALFLLFVAAGCPGLKSLNRLDQQRRIKLCNFAVEITRGTKTSVYAWKRFFSYQETQNLFLLRTQFAVWFWTIPKRALHARDEERLRSLLDRQLPQQ